MDSPATGAPQTPAAPPASPTPAPSGPKSNKTLIIIIAVVLGLALLGVGCNVLVGKMVGFGMKKAFEAGTGVEVDEKGDTVTYKGPDGSTMEVTGDGSGTVTFKGADGQTVEVQGQGEGEVKTMPTKFPSDFPVKSGMTLESTYSLSADGADSFTLSWTTDASAEAVARYYEETLKERGWRITATTEASGQFYVSFERGPEDATQKDSGWITAAADEGGKTTVGLFLTTAAK